MKYSLGYNLIDDFDNEVLRVPTGYQAIVTMFFVTNNGASTSLVTATWHNNENIVFLADKSLAKGEITQFGGPEGHFLVMNEGDYMTVTPGVGATMTCIISFDLIRNSSSYLNLYVDNFGGI